MRRDDVEHALDALASEVPAPNADAAAVIARGRQRVLRRRVIFAGIAVVVIATAASVGAATRSDQTRNVVSPVPTTTTIPRTPATGPAQEIAAVSALEAWKCLNPLQYTDDGGRSWQSVALPERVPSYLTSCTAVAGGNAWLVWSTDGYAWHVLRIRNARETAIFSFPRLPDPGADNLTQLTFVDPNHGWVRLHNDAKPVGLYRTVDGGATWDLATNQPLGALVFADADRGWSTYDDQLLRTSDGGVSWETVDLPTLAARGTFDSVEARWSRTNLFQVVAINNAIVVWSGVHIGDNRYRHFFDVSGDDGRTWVLRAGPEGFEGKAFNAIDASHWQIASGPALRITDDGGRTWQHRPHVPGVATIRSMSFPTPDVGWISAAQFGSILRTIDGGRTWTDVTDGAAPETTPTTPRTTSEPGSPPMQPPQLAFASATEGWICGDPFVYTTDAFETAGENVEIPAPARSESLGYYQEPLCAAASGGSAWLLRGSDDPDQPELVRIRSGGAEVQVFPFARFLPGTVVSMTFADADHGWALVRRQGATRPLDLRDLYRTLDGGATWSLVLRDAPISGSLDFDTADRGWATAGEGPKLVATTDGGRTWDEVAVPTPAPHPALPLEVRSVKVRGNVIVAFGGQATGNFVEPFLDVSTNGGRTWDRRRGPRGFLRAQPYAFDAADADHWAVGWANFLYVTADGGRTWVERGHFAGVYAIEDVALVNANVAIVSARTDSGRSTVQKTTDGGTNWTTIR